MRDGYVGGGLEQALSPASAFASIPSEPRGVYVVNSIGQVFGFRETGRQFGDILRTLNWSCDEELRDISPASFDELNLDDPLIREHFSKRANSFAAAAAEEGLSFFFIGAESDKMNSVWRQG